MSFLDTLTASPLYKDVVDLGKTYITSQGKVPVGGLNTTPVTVTGDGQVVAAGQSAPVSASNPLADALSPLVNAYAAREANRELNANPPYWLYGLGAMALVAVFLVVRK